MSRIRANNIVNGAGTGAPTFPNGAVINGISTITADVSLNTSQLNGTDADFSGIGTYGVVSLGTGTSISSPSDNVLTLGTNNTEALRITANGDTQVSSGSSLFINNGNLVFSTSGTGIDFQPVGVNSTTATSHILDDYEEGTWTPVFVSGQGSVPAGSSFTSSGTYVKVGRWVYAYYTFNFNTATATTIDDRMALAGLPYLSTGMVTITGAGSAWQYSSISSGVNNHWLAGATEGVNWYLYLIHKDGVVNYNIAIRGYLAYTQ